MLVGKDEVVEKGNDVVVVVMEDLGAVRPDRVAVGAKACTQDSDVKRTVKRDETARTQLLVCWVRRLPVVVVMIVLTVRVCRCSCCCCRLLLPLASRGVRKCRFGAHTHTHTQVK